MKKAVHILLLFTIIFSLSIPVSAAANNTSADSKKVSNELKVEPQKLEGKTDNLIPGQLKNNIQFNKVKMDLAMKKASDSSLWFLSKAWGDFKQSMSNILTGIKDKTHELAADIKEKAQEITLNIKEFTLGIKEKTREIAYGVKGVFASDNSENDKAKAKNELIKQAEKFNVDITGLNEKEAWDKIKKAEAELHNTDKEGKNDLINQAKKFNVDITGLSEKEAWNKIKKAEEELYNKPNMNGQEDLNKQAKKFKVDISGLSVEEAWTKIKQAEKDLIAAEQVKQDEIHLKELLPMAKRLGVDITGLSFQEAFKKVNAANDAANWQGVLRAAADYGVNVTGLTLEQAEAKIRQARAEDQGVNINGLSPQEAEKLLEATKNNQMTTEGILLQNTCGLLKLNTNATVSVMKEQVSSKLGINLSGLSLEQETNKIIEALAKRGLKLP